LITLILVLLLIVVLLASWVLTLLGMPGNWLMVVATATYAYFVPADSAAAVGWKVVAILAVLAGLGELVELVAVAAGTVRAGGSRRGAVLALFGSIVGALLGVCIGLPVPLVGSLLAALFFAGLGAAVGAILGEISAGKNMAASLQISKGAFWGRLIGTMGKMLVGAVMLAVVAAALVL
jgi:uncharacterized protein